MLSGKKLRTDIPSVCKTVRFEDKFEKARKRDERMKEHLKKLSDARNKAVEFSLQTGARVLVKQRPSNKAESPFKAEPYEVKKTLIEQ